MSMTKIAGSGSESGSISQRHRSADPDPGSVPKCQGSATLAYCIKRIPVGVLIQRRGRDPASKDPLRLSGHGEGVSVRVEAAHYLEAEGHAPGAQSQGNLPEEGKYCISSKNPQKLKFSNFFLLLPEWLEDRECWRCQYRRNWRF